MATLSPSAAPVVVAQEATRAPLVQVQVQGAALLEALALGSVGLGKLSARGFEWNGLFLFFELEKSISCTLFYPLRVEIRYLKAVYFTWALLPYRSL